MNLADLTKRYQEKSEEELLRFAADSLHLTPEARTVLRGELAKRGISAEHWHVPDNASRDDKAETGFKHRVLRSSEAKLIEDVWRLYRNRVWLFVTLIAPAVSIGALALLVSRYEVREILKHFPRGLDTFQHRAELFEIMVLKASRNIITGFTFCLCFGAICAAVEQIESGLVVSIGECLEAVRQQLRRVLQLSLVLLTLLILVEVLTFLVSQGIYWGILQRYFSYASGILFLPLAYLISALGLLVLSRLGLAMPAIILDDYTVANALFRSDELTEGKWLTLAVLLFKCIVVGYVAALWPFWLAQWIPNTISLPAWFPWFLWIASVMAVAFVEPVMFIGFALLYIRESGLSSALEQKKPVTVECWGDALAILRTEKPAACTAGFFQEEGRETSVRGSLSAGWCPASALPRTAPSDQLDGDGRQSCAARSHADALLECCSVCSRVPTLETSALDSPSGIALDRAEPQADISNLAIRGPNQKSEIVMRTIKKLNGGGWGSGRMR